MESTSETSNQTKETTMSKGTKNKAKGESKGNGLDTASLRKNRVSAARQVGTRFTDEEFKALLERANEEKATSLSNFIRHCCGFEPLR